MNLAETRPYQMMTRMPPGARLADAELGGRPASTSPGVLVLGLESRKPAMA